MSRETYVLVCEGLKGRLPWATRLKNSKCKRYLCLEEIFLVKDKKKRNFLNLVS